MRQKKGDVVAAAGHSEPNSASLAVWSVHCGKTFNWADFPEQMFIVIFTDNNNGK